METKLHIPKVLLVATIIVLAILLILVNLKYFDKFISNPKNPNYPKSKELQNWYTYTSKVFAFEFKYPASWTVMDTDYGADILEPNSSYAFTINVYENISNPDEFIKTQTSSTGLEDPEKPLKVGEYESYHKVFKNNNANYTQNEIFAKSDGKVYGFVFLTDSTQRTETIAKILSTFVVLDPNTLISPTAVPQNVSDACVITGCSGQICSEKEVVTTCDYYPEYECYKKATCEKQLNDKCGWTKTEAFNSCIVNLDK